MTYDRTELASFLSKTRHPLRLPFYEQPLIHPTGMKQKSWGFTLTRLFPPSPPNHRSSPKSLTQSNSLLHYRHPGPSYHLLSPGWLFSFHTFLHKAIHCTPTPTLPRIVLVASTYPSTLTYFLLIILICQARFSLLVIILPTPYVFTSKS